MTVMIELPSDIEAALLAQAQAEGLDVADYVQNLVRRHVTAAANQENGNAYADAMRSLGTFGKRHNLSLGGATVK
jgi:hypothetical protein